MLLLNLSELYVFLFYTIKKWNYKKKMFAVIPSDLNCPYRTCLSYGPNYYRTFDSLEFLFAGRCSYTMFDDGVRSVVVSMDQCYWYTTCKKVSTATHTLHVKK